MTKKDKNEDLEYIKFLLESMHSATQEELKAYDEALARNSVTVSVDNQSATGKVISPQLEFDKAILDCLDGVYKIVKSYATIASHDCDKRMYRYYQNAIDDIDKAYRNAYRKYGEMGEIAD